MDPENPRAQALAARGDRIAAVGSTEEIETLVGPTTEVIDLGGQTAVPGLIDGHGHYVSLGASLMQLDLRSPRTWDEIVALVKEAAKKAEPGEWIVGRGWHQDKWTERPSPSVEGLPVHQALSEVSPDNPVVLKHVSGHGVFVNARALELVGYDRATKDPAGGEIVRDEQGDPIGMLRETAMDPVLAALEKHRAKRPPAVQEAELREQVRLAGMEAVRNGITTFHDMGEPFAIIELLQTMADEGNLPVRLYVAIEEPASAMEGRLAEVRTVGRGNGFLTVRAIGEKVLDGALGTHGGWLLEPYEDLPRSTGFNVTPIEDIRRSAELAAEHGYQMAIQGIGDRAVRELLDIYQATYDRHDAPQDLRWRIEHCQVVHPDDLARFAKLGVIASVRGVFATSDGLWVETRLGKKRTAERGYPYRSFFESGAIVVNGTDPPVEDIDPIDNFFRSVTRRMTNGEVFHPEQRMTREQAMASYTTNAAYAGFEEADKGTLAPGKLADVTVLSGDLLEVTDDAITTTKVAYTIIAGRTRYRGGRR
jgi:predicted amidohydrolase YtcJ